MMASNLQQQQLWHVTSVSTVLPAVAAIGQQQHEQVMQATPLMIGVPLQFCFALVTGAQQCESAGNLLTAPTVTLRLPA
jgi:hypothetical protein